MKKGNFLKLVWATFSISFFNFAFGQQVAINTSGTVVNASAGLDVDFTSKGLLISRVSLTSTSDVTTISSPATGLLVYNVATAGVSPNNVTPGFYYYTGTAWWRLQTSANGVTSDWSLTGNTGTTPTTNFLGTLDDVDFLFARSGSRVGLIGSTNTLFGSSFAYASLGSRNTGRGTSGYAFQNDNVSLGVTCFGGGATANNMVVLGLNVFPFGGTASRSIFAGSSCCGTNSATTGVIDNVGIGQNSMTRTAASKRNIAVGANAMYFNQNGVGNTALGDQAIQGTTTVDMNYNVGIGINSLMRLNNGNYNTGAGYNSGSQVTTGANNIFLGSSIGNVTTGSSNISIGSAGNVFSNFQLPSATNSNQLRIGSTIYKSSSGMLIGINTSVPATTLDISATTAIKVPVGTTLQQPTPATGMIRFNSDIMKFEGFDGTTWVTLN